MPNQEKIAIDLRRWRKKTKEEVIQDISAFPIESADLPLEKRVNITVLSLADFARLCKNGSREPEDIATEKIFQWALEKTSYLNLIIPSTHPTELEILDQTADFIDFNPREIAIWISPAEEGVYKESRLGIYQVISVNGEKYLLFRSLCGSKEHFKYQNIFSKLPATSCKNPAVVEASPQEVRANPVIVEVSGSSLIAFLENIIEDIPEIWDSIRQGQDILMKQKSIKIALGLLSDQTYRDIQEASTFWRQVEIGRYLERELEQRFDISLKLGSCGILYSSLSTTLFSSPLLGSIYFPATEGTRRKHCGKCGKYGNFTEGESCPYDQSSRN